MLPRVLEKRKFETFVNTLAQEYSVFGPVLKERTKAG